MKKLLLIAVLAVTASFQAFAEFEAGVACTSVDARCTGYDLDVEANVLQSIQFDQLQLLSLGDVARGETVTVANDSMEQTRGRQYGSLSIMLDQAVESIKINCLPAQSKVNFGGEAEADKALASFSTCLMVGAVIKGGEFPLPELITAEDGSNSSIITIDNSAGDISQAQLEIGGSIVVPNTSKVTDGAKTGNLRVEVVYE